MFKEFVDYVSEFYEEGKGIYAADFVPPVKREEIEAAASYVSVMCGLFSEDMGEFIGDSVDRERVRSVLDSIRNRQL